MRPPDPQASRALRPLPRFLAHTPRAGYATSMMPHLLPRAAVAVAILGLHVAACGGVAVGTPVARRPPHRSQRAGLPHWAPASGRIDDQARFGNRDLSYSLQRALQAWHVVPHLRTAPVTLGRVPLGRPPSLHSLRGWLPFGRRCFRCPLGCLRRFHLRARVGGPMARLRPFAAFVQELPRYYESVRLPLTVHRRLAPKGFPTRTPAPSAVAGPRISRFPYEWSTYMLGVLDRARPLPPRDNGSRGVAFRMV